MAKKRWDPGLASGGGIRLGLFGSLGDTVGEGGDGGLGKVGHDISENHRKRTGRPMLGFSRSQGRDERPSSFYTFEPSCHGTLAVNTIHFGSFGFGVSAW